MEEKNLQEKNLQEIPPYRLNQLMKAASLVTDKLVSSVWNMSPDEMELVLDLVRFGVEKTKEAKNVPE